MQGGRGRGPGKEGQQVFTQHVQCLQPHILRSALRIPASALPTALTLLWHRYLFAVHPNGCSHWAFCTSPRTSPVVPSASLSSSRAAWLLFLRSYCSALEPSPTALFAPFTAFDSATPSSLETLPFLGFSCPSSHLPGCTISVSCAGSFFQLAHYLLISSLAYCPCLICTQNVKAGFW